MFDPIEAGQVWQTIDSLNGLGAPRFATVKAIAPGEHNLPKGPTHRPPDDEVEFDLAFPTRCSTTAFRKSYRRIS